MLTVFDENPFNDVPKFLETVAKRQARVQM